MPSYPIKVLQVIPSVTPERGGTSTWLKTITRSIAQRGAEVHVATTDDGVAPPPSVSYGQPALIDGVTYWYFPRQTSFYTVSLPLRAWLRKHVADYNVVHVHALFSYPAIPAAFWARRNQIPYIVQPHGMLSPWGLSNRRRWLKKISLRWIERPILSGCAAVAFTTQQEQEEAKTLGLVKRSVTIPLGAEVPDPHLYHREAVSFRSSFGLDGRKVILFLGRLEPKKGLDLLLAAFASVRGSQPDAVLVIAGNGEAAYTAALKQDAVRLGIDGEIRWIGFQQGAGKWAALAAADLFVLPSYAENFGIAAVEAMLFGLPLLITDQVGIHREVAHSRAGLIGTCQVESIAERLQQLLRDECLRRELGANALELARREFTMSRVTTRFLDFYSELRSDCRAAV